MGKMGKTKMINAYSIQYHKKRLKNFWKKWTVGGKHYRSINWWIRCMKLDPMRAGKEAKSLIKDFIRIGVLENKYSVEEGNRLWDMIKSEDEENQYIALSIIQTHYPRAFVKEKEKVSLV